MVATEVAYSSSVRLLHNIPILYSFIYFLETCVICLSYAVMQNVKFYILKLLGQGHTWRSRSYMAVKVHILFYVYPYLSCGSRLLDDRSINNILDSLQRKEI